jgi:hypothetical protein
MREKEACPPLAEALSNWTRSTGIPDFHAPLLRA